MDLNKCKTCKHHSYSLELKGKSILCSNSHIGDDKNFHDNYEQKTK